MTALNFPNHPSFDDIWPIPPIEGIQWRWDGSKWIRIGGGNGDGAATVIASDTPPLAPAPNTLWFNTVDHVLYLWYDDGISQQWIAIAGGIEDAVAAAITNTLASAAQLRAMTTGRVIGTDGLKDALAIQSFGGVSGNVQPDFTQFVNGRWVLLGNINLQFPSVSLTPVIGRSGLLTFSMSAAATISYAAGYTFHEMQVPDITTTVGRLNLFAYSIWDATRINLALIGGGIA